MAASSVSGVGNGSAESASKGQDGRQTLDVSHLLGVRVYDCGVATLGGQSPSTVAVKFAQPIDNASNYCVILTGQGSTAALASQGYIYSSLTTSGFTITSANGATNNVSWVLVRLKY